MHSEIDMTANPKPKLSPLRRAIWRGSSIIAPPLVTLLLLIWIASAVEDYVIRPLEGAGRSVLVWWAKDILETAPADAELNDASIPAAGFIYAGKIYVPPPSGRKFIPEHVLLYVDANIDLLPREMQDPKTAIAYYHAYVKLQYMPRWFTIPLLLLVLFSLLFFVGRFLAAGVGRMFVNGFERAINSLPVVRNLYSSVKQVTDFVLSEREIEFTRVVAIEHPRVGIWALGFVTGPEGLPQLEAALGEDMAAVFVPTSPMPMTGFTVNCRKRDLIDLDLTIDQAIQFIVSCGVVCPTAGKMALRTAAPVRIDPHDPSE